MCTHLEFSGCAALKPPGVHGGPHSTGAHPSGPHQDSHPDWAKIGLAKIGFGQNWPGQKEVGPNWIGNQPNEDGQKGIGPNRWIPCLWVPVFSRTLGRKLCTTKLHGFERKVDRVLGLHQTRLDKHDAELDSQRRLLEDLKTEVSLQENSFDTGRMSCDTSSDTTSGSSLRSEWCSQNVLVRGWAPFGSRRSSKTDRIEHKKLCEDLLSLLPTSLQNNVVVRAPLQQTTRSRSGSKEVAGTCAVKLEML